MCLNGVVSQKKETNFFCRFVEKRRKEDTSKKNKTIYPVEEGREGKGRKKKKR